MPTQPPPTTLNDQVERLVREVLDETPFYLVALDVRGQKGSRVVDVFIDGDEPVGVDNLAEVSRQVSFLLDAEDVIAGRYNLNVSSPGADRPLTLPRQYRKHVGRPLRVELAAPDEEGRTVVEGELLSADDEHIELAVSKKQQARVPYGQISQARVQLPW